LEEKRPNQHSPRSTPGFGPPRPPSTRGVRGACPTTHNSHTGTRGRPEGERGDWDLRYELRVAPRAILVRLKARFQSMPPRRDGPLIRYHMRRSLRLLAQVTRLLEDYVQPTHMLTLTLPEEAWEDLPSDEARLELWTSALDRFLHALRVRLNRLFGKTWGWLWWLEFQPRRGAPHLHVLLDLGGVLSAEAWRDWKDWITEAWSRAIGVPAPYATRFEALRDRSFNYVRAYAYGSRKAPQKRFPFPGKWGRSWGVAGTWKEVLHYERLCLWEDASIYALDRSVLEALPAAVEEALAFYPERQNSYTASVFLRGLQGVLKGRRLAIEVILPPPSLDGENDPLIYAVVVAIADVLERFEKAPISAPLPGSSPSPRSPVLRPPRWGGNGGSPPLRGGLGGWFSPGGSSPRGSGADPRGPPG